MHKVASSLTNQRNSKYLRIINAELEKLMQQELEEDAHDFFIKK